MNDASKEEARLLSGVELELVAVTRPSEIERQSVDELKAAARRLREAHDRARGIGTRQAREMRGKAEPRGAKPAKDNSGTVAKAQALRDALDRVEAELSRREAAPIPKALLADS
jgi:hypothetical protein